MPTLTSLLRSRTGLASLALAGLLPFAAVPAEAQVAIEYPYCLMQGRHTGQSCTFMTLQQCQASISANSGFCDRNPRYIAPSRPVRGHR
ncbi:hypothetical protein X566_20315 [Afipia sp. P52-10]|jgi:hypothetical protein|uniref:DUF3551 domain-containing protein n=1 Tax=Afipia sp. P52-10 TaxID=1429916 RepID=UPI0003DF0C6F|nr:DUF3551 domain-containing protein [Afipia sp. P52-10]ETR75087.1 hypothetical protein X566_20315 [Afipia sp. P52-10]